MSKGGYSKTKYHSVSQDVFGLAITCALLTYLLIGLFAGIWHPTWILFVIALCVGIVSDLIGYWIYNRKIKGNDALSFDKQFENSFVYSRSVRVSGYLFMFSIVAYVISAAFTGLWHPLWLIFIGMAVVEQTVAIVMKSRYKDFHPIEEFQPNSDGVVSNNNTDK